MDNNLNRKIYYLLVAIMAISLLTNFQSMTRGAKFIFRTLGSISGLFHIAQAENGTVLHNCLDTGDWHRSDIFNPNTKWSNIFMERVVTGSSYFSQFLDVNGDGLLDYVYNGHPYYSSGTIKENHSCIYLNNGEGWDPVFRCREVSYLDSVTQKWTTSYYGDCAL